MKIGLVVEWLDASRGGAETSTGQFIDELLKLDHSVELYTRSSVSPRSGLTVRTIDARGITRVSRTAAFLNVTERAIETAGCDLIHAMVPCRGADVYQPRGGLVAETVARTLASRPAGVARWTKRIDLAMNRRQRMMHRREVDLLTGQHPPTVIAISEYVKRQLRDHFNYPESRITLIFNGVIVPPMDAAARERDRRHVRGRYGVDEATLLLLQVCHNFHLKGVRTLIEAVAGFARSSDVPIMAMVVGRGHPRPWQAMASRLGVERSVVFTGPSDRVATMYHAADVLVHPTFYDPCSRVVLEGLAYGLPAITTRYDGAAEMIEEGVTGFVLTSPNRSDDLVLRLAVLADRATRLAMSHAAVEQAGRATMSRHAQQVDRLYRKLLQ